jgi:hypothetical protein
MITEATVLTSTHPDYRYLTEKDDCMFILDEPPDVAEKKTKTPALSSIKRTYGDGSQLMHQTSTDDFEKNLLKSVVAGRVLIPSDSNIFLCNFIDLVFIMNKNEEISLLSVLETILTLESHN